MVALEGDLYIPKVSDIHSPLNEASESLKEE